MMFPSLARENFFGDSVCRLFPTPAPRPQCCQCATEESHITAIISVVLRGVCADRYLPLCCLLGAGKQTLRWVVPIFFQSLRRGWVTCRSPAPPLPPPSEATTAIALFQPSSSTSFLKESPAALGLFRTNSRSEKITSKPVTDTTRGSVSQLVQTLCHRCFICSPFLLLSEDFPLPMD